MLSRRALRSFLTFFLQRNNRLVWVEALHLVNELIHDVWEDRETIVIEDLVHDLSTPVRNTSSLVLDDPLITSS